VQSMAESIQQYSCAGETLEQVAHRRIVVCTCSTAGQLHIIKLPKGHFTHVFVDEVRLCLSRNKFNVSKNIGRSGDVSCTILQAGQATEPEVLIALTLAAGGDNQVLFSLSNL
jgi:hypothetical protein